MSSSAGKGMGSGLPNCMHFTTVRRARPVASFRIVQYLHSPIWTVTFVTWNSAKRFSASCH